jgi:hypothetical protein
MAEWTGRQSRAAAYAGVTLAHDDRVPFVTAPGDAFAATETVQDEL